MAYLGDFNFPDFAFAPQSTQTFDDLPPIQTSNLYPAPSSAGSPAALDSAAPSQKRKASSPASAENYEDASRFAAEEDKRRRNTAASARFRVKKKQREQALERSAKEMSDKVSALEGRINQLETENKWLKNLIVERNGSEKGKGDEVAELWKKYSETEKSDRKGSERKDGVGTRS